MALPLESAAGAMEPAAFTAEAGFSVMRFNYTELDNAGTTLDKELGGIPGLSLRLAQRLSAWEWDGAANYYYGRVDYAGRDSNGAPVNTTTKEMIGDVALRLGYWFEGSLPIMPYAGLGYRLWDRDILHVGSVGGLFESYRWKYVWLGAKIIAYQQGASNLMLDVGWIKPLDPVMYIDTYSARLNPESRDGLRLMLTSHTAFDENTTLIIEPYFEYWQLGNSPTVITSVGPRYEPVSKTKNIGFNLRLGRSF